MARNQLPTVPSSSPPVSQEVSRRVVDTAKMMFAMMMFFFIVCFNFQFSITVSPRLRAFS